MRALRRPRPLQGRQRQHRPRRRRRRCCAPWPSAWPSARARRTPRRASAATSSPCCSRTTGAACAPRRSPSGSSPRCAGPSTSRARRSSSAPRSASPTPHDASLGPDELLRNADLAMYRAKKAGGNRAATYETAMRTALLARIELEADLRHALERDELALAYQPVVELQSGRTVGVEALARWAHPTRGPIPPLTFIPVAEEIGLIGAIGRWVLREACRQLAAWRRLAPELVLNVNLSAAAAARRPPGQRRRAGAAGLRAAGRRAHARDHREHAAVRRRGHRGAPAAPEGPGLSIAVDDFGTGYSSLSYLKQFPVDALKIDKSFVDTVARSTADSALARTIVELGRGMRLETIAEGIENVEQLEQLRMLDCQLGQGYHFSDPAGRRRADRLPRADARATSGARPSSAPAIQCAAHAAVSTYGPQDPRRRGQAGPRRARPRGEDHRPRAARRRHGGHLHRAAPDARADRGDRHPGGRRRRRALDPLGRAHDARAADRRAAQRAGDRRRAADGRAARSPPTTSPSSSAWAWRRSSRPGAPTQDIIDFIQGAVGDRERS